MWKPATYREMILYQIILFVLVVAMFIWWWFDNPKSPQHGKVVVTAIFMPVMFVLHGFRVLRERRQEALQLGDRFRKCQQCGYSREGIAACDPCPECGFRLFPPDLPTIELESNKDQT